MNAKLQNGKITIDVYELIDSLSSEEQVQLIEQLSCFDAVLKHVGEQILEGWTENGYWGGKSCGPEPSTPLSKMRERVAVGASEVAKSEIETLKYNWEFAEKSRNEAWTKNHELENQVWELKRLLK